MSETKSLSAGFAEVDWTPEPGLPLLGQMHERIATGTRDPLLANAMALQTDGTPIVLMSVDICILDEAFVEAVKKKWTERTGLDAARLLLHSTHTHVAPAATSILRETAEPQLLARLQDAIVQVGQAALARLEPVEVFAGTGHMEQMGWNRRAMYEDGSSRMYGNSTNPGFIGMEGPRDPALPVLFTRNASGDITGVVVNFATHPNSIEGDVVYSADIPGASRKYLKQLLGQNVTVLYLTGAAGNTAPSLLDPFVEAQPWRGNEGLERSGLYLAGQAAQVIAATLEPMAPAVLHLEQTTLSIPLRPWPQPGEPTYPAWGDSSGDAYYDHASSMWPEHLQKHSPLAVRVNVLRIGDAVICTNPAELFVEFGLQIRAQSPARVTFVNELCDGYVGYVPTPLAFSRGGYETWCAPSSQLDPSAGDQIVAATDELMKAAWQSV